VVQNHNEAVFHLKQLKELAPQFAAASTLKEIETILEDNNFEAIDWIKSKVPQPSQEEEGKWGPAITAYLEKMKLGGRLEGVPRSPGL
jgi:hypothetical protein